MTANEVLPKNDKVRKGRLGSKKTRTGCLTCKIRRVKCDETHPICERCSSTGRHCDGYPGVTTEQSRSTSTASSPRDNTDRALSISPSRAFHHTPSTTPIERRAFDYYIHSAAPSFAGAADIDFWCRVVPQVSLDEPLVWDALIAIASLHESSDGSGSMKLLESAESPADSLYHSGVKWYSRAIKRLKQMMEERTDSASLALLTSVLFMCIEMIQDDIHGALGLVKQSAKLLGHLYDTGGFESSPVAIAASPIVKWLCNDSASFGQPLKPLEYASPLERESLDSTLGITSFRTISEARAALHTFFPTIFATFQDAKEYKQQIIGAFDTLASITSHQREIQLRLQNWLSSWNSSPLLHAANATDTARRAAALLLKDHTTATILSQTCLNREETSFDAYNPLFESIVQNIATAIGIDPDSQVGANETTLPIRNPSFRFESGIIPSLCFVVSRCRQPLIRRRALALLDLAPRKESLWKASLARRVMQKIVAYEEGTTAVDEHRLLPIELVSVPEEAQRVFEWEVVNESWAMDENFELKWEKEPILLRVSRHVFAADGTREVVCDYLSA